MYCGATVLAFRKRLCLAEQAQQTPHFSFDFMEPGKGCLPLALELVDPLAQIFDLRRHEEHPVEVRPLRNQGRTGYRALSRVTGDAPGKGLCPPCQALPSDAERTSSSRRCAESCQQGRHRCQGAYPADNRTALCGAGRSPERCTGQSAARARSSLPRNCHIETVCTALASTSLWRDKRGPWRGCHSGPCCTTAATCSCSRRERRCCSPRTRAGNREHDQARGG